MPTLAQALFADDEKASRLMPPFTLKLVPQMRKLLPRGVEVELNGSNPTLLPFATAPRPLPDVLSGLSQLVQSWPRLGGVDGGQPRRARAHRRGRAPL